MANYSRFGLIPLPLSLKDRAVKGEFLVDPNTGHIYLKNSDNGNLISKTVELEERINAIEAIRMHSITDASFDGSQLEYLISNKSRYTVEGNSAKINSNIITFDKIPFFMSPFYKYILELNYIPNGQNVIATAECTNFNLEMHSITKSRISDDECFLLYEFACSNSRIDNEEKLIFGLSDCDGITLKHISLRKVPINNSNCSLQLTGTILKQLNPNISTNPFMITYGTEDVLEILPFIVPASPGININMNKFALLPGLYSLDISLLSNFSGNLYITTTSKDNTKLSYTINCNSVNKLYNKYKSSSSTNELGLKVLTTAISIPPSGLKNINIHSSSGNCYINSLKFDMIGTALYDHRTI